MMKKNRHVLLTTSAAPSQSPFSTTEKRPPVGVGFLISVLRNAGHEVFFIDNYLKPSDFLETDYLTRNDIDYVGIYANTICFRDTLRMLYKLEYMRKTGKWQGKIMIGGPHTTVSPDTIPDFVDYVVQGEGERAILDIVEGKVKERIVKYPPIENLDELPMPAWDYFAALPYKWDVDWFPGKPVFTMNTSRGCPFRCAFCSVDSIWGKRYNFFSAERLVSDIEYLIKQYGAQGIYFREDNFTLNKKRLTEFCNLLIEKGINILWACETRVNTLNRELVGLMHRAGARAFYLGVESGSQRILDFLNKGITVAQIKNAFDLCREYGIKTAASIIVGVPGETEDDVLQTARLMQEVKPTVTWYNVFVGIPHSELYQYVLDHKLYEFIDDRGLVYLKGHNQRVRRFYGKQWNADVPVTVIQNRIADPEISVVMSTYNNGKFLEEAVKSILRQTFQNFELIIIDDASTDNTSAVLNKLCDPRIKVITNPENLGLTKSLNKGIEHARGKYIARMDADDISLPHRLEMQIDFLRRNPDHALAGSSYYQMNEKGEINNLIKVLTEDTAIKEGLKKQNWFGHGSVMIVREALQKAGGYNERFKYAQDYDLWLRLSENYKIANLKEPLYCWRTTSNSISGEKAQEQRHYAELAVAEAENRSNGSVSCDVNEYLVSVIIPTYNRPDTLTRAIESVLKQTISDFEIIVVNDAGADVENVVTGLNKENRITYAKHSKNRGLAAARNTGIKLARGKYIAYLDDDDIFYPEHLETLTNELQNSNYRIAYTDACRSTLVNENGKYVEMGKDVPYSHDFNYDQILVTNFIPVVCFMHERSCLNKTGLFDESLRVLEDWDLWIRMSREFEMHHVKKVTAEFTWKKDGSTMTSKGKEEFVRTGQIIQKKYRKYAADKLHVLHAQQKAYRQDRRNIFEQGEQPLVSVIIPAFDDAEQLMKCLGSIASNTSYEPFEVIIVDGSGDRSSSEMIKECVQGDIKIVSMDNGKRGYHEACNKGAGAAEGKYLMFLDSSLSVSGSWLEELVRTLECNEACGIAGGNILYMDNTIENAGIVLNKEGIPLNIFNGARASNPAVNDLREYDAVTSSCMLISKELFSGICGLDTDTTGDSGIELSGRAKGRGHKVICEPRAVFYKQGHSDGAQDDEQKKLLNPQQYFKEKTGAARAYLAEEKTAEAISIFVKLLDDFPQVKELYSIVCDLYITMGWKNIPGAWIVKALKQAPAFIETFNSVAAALCSEEKYFEAYEMLSLLKEISEPDNKNNGNGGSQIQCNNNGRNRHNIYVAENTCAGADESRTIEKKKIAIVRGANLNKWEMQNYEPLMNGFDITAFTTTQTYFNISEIKLPVVKLPFQYRGLLLNMNGLEEQLAGKDIVFTADITYKFSEQAVQAKRMYGYKVVCIEWENVPFNYEEHEVVRKIKETVRQGADHFIAVTQRAKEALMLEGVPEEKIEVIFMGIDLEKFKPAKDHIVSDRDKLGIGKDDFIILFIGRMVWEKGVYDFVHAASKILSDKELTGCPVKFLMVGKGAELQRVKKRAETLGISGRFFFIEEYPYQEMNRIHNLADVFVLPSISINTWQEQFGMVLIESMACGKPVISTLSGSIPEVVGDAGVLIQPNDHLMLYEGMKALITDKELRERLGREALSRAMSEFDARKTAEKVRAVFEKVLKQEMALHFLT